MSERFKDILSVGIYFTVILSGIAGVLIILDNKFSGIFLYYLAGAFLFGMVLMIVGNWFIEAITYKKRSQQQRVINTKAQMQNYGKAKRIETIDDNPRCPCPFNKNE